MARRGSLAAAALERRASIAVQVLGQGCLGGKGLLRNSSASYCGGILVWWVGGVCSAANLRHVYFTREYMRSEVVV